MRKTEVMTFSAPPELAKALDAATDIGERSKFIRQAIEARLRERQRSRARRQAAAGEQSEVAA